MNRSQLYPVALVAALAAPACLDGRDEDDVDLATTTELLVRNPADPPVSRGPAVLDLLSGHHAKLPVSSFFSGTKTVGTGTTGAHTFQVKTFDCSGDTGIFVRSSNASGGFTGAWYNDDGPAGSGGAAGTSPDKGSEVTARGTGLTNFTVHVFSQTRATAFCSLWFRIDSGSWQFWKADHFGGALVELGALRAGDFVQVQTPNNGGATGAEDDTQMLVFDADIPLARQPGATYMGFNAPIFNGDRSSTVRDPRVDIPAGTGNSWSLARTFALIGKTTRTSSVRGVETNVEVMRGPLNAPVTDTLPFTASTGLSNVIALDPGRYTLWVDAASSSPVGSLSRVDNPNSTLIAGSCNKTTGTFSGKPKALYRGQLNDDGFAMAIEGDFNGLWAPILLDTGNAKRKIPLGAFGSENQFHRFAVSFDVRTRRSYRLAITGKDSSVSIGAQVHIRRNVDSTELKVAQHNMFYGNSSVNEPMNAADLLATRGTVNLQTFQVEERLDQAPYQWQADIVGLTEVHPDHPADFWQFRDEAQLRNAPRWSYRQDINEMGLGGWNVGRGGVLVNDLHWPDFASPDSISHSNAALSHAGCDFGSCEIWDNGSVKGKQVIPVRVRVSRNNPIADRPITAVEVHLKVGPDGAQLDRFKEIESLAGRIEGLLDTSCAGCSDSARAFNKDNNPDPKAPGNRILLIGDFNVYNHGCGESYYLLRLLRERFGYAVDAAFAAEGSVEFAFGMHNYGDTSHNGNPWPWQHWVDWRDLDDANPLKWLMYPDGENSFPWWARTFRSSTASPGKGDERTDMVLLVGRGWELDDPVRSYVVMQDNDKNKENPFAVLDASGNVLGGVEMYHDESGNGGVPNSGTNYNPNRSVGAGTGPGRAALQTDHRPILARLRVLTPGTANDR